MSTSNRPSAKEMSEFITLFHAAGSRLIAMRRTIAKGIDLDPPQFAALLALTRLDRGKGVRVRALADEVHVAPANMTATVNALLRGNWVHKTGDPEDSRAVRVSLTDHGKARLAAQLEATQRINAVWFNGVTREQVRQACSVLATLLHNYEEAALIANAAGRKAGPPR
jgi:DNA-binding MarR family transcriptional regulator